jgi:pimeloyl-ACP methyl ester carboxylesterase
MAFMNLPSLAVLLWMSSASTEKLYEIRLEKGTRVTPAGDSVPYSLFVPVPSLGLPKPPWPALVLSHGFARNRRYHEKTARYLASRGIVTMTPNLLKLGGGRPAQLRNVRNTADHVAWLVERSSTPTDSLAGLVDERRIGLAGHSAGGAVSFEAAVASSKTDHPVEALLLLDAVPWSRTAALAPDLLPMDFASLRSEPSSCNAFASVVALLPELRFPNEDVRILGATHCDPENPTDVLCRIVCGGKSGESQSLYQRLTYLFLKDALRAPGLEDESYREALSDLASKGVVEVEPDGLAVALRLDVNGRHGSGVVATTGPVLLTLDAFARPAQREADCYLALIRSGQVLWVTPGGIRTTPSPLRTLTPISFDDATLFETTLSAGDSVTFFLFLVDGMELLAHDSVTAVGQ